MVSSMLGASTMTVWPAPSSGRSSELIVCVAPSSTTTFEIRRGLARRTSRRQHSGGGRERAVSGWKELVEREVDDFTFDVTEESHAKHVAQAVVDLGIREGNAVAARFERHDVRPCLEVGTKM